MKLAVILVVFSLKCFGTSERDCLCDCTSNLPLTKIGDKFYYVELNKKDNWFTAMAFCNLHNMHLANVLSEAENSGLEQHFKDLGVVENRFWTSGSDLAGEGRWFWMGAGTRMVYQYWEATQPDNLGEEDCLDVRVTNDVLVWNDNNCLAQLNFICEAKCA